MIRRPTRRLLFHCIWKHAWSSWSELFKTPSREQIRGGDRRRLRVSWQSHQKLIIFTFASISSEAPSPTSATRFALQKTNFSDRRLVGASATAATEPLPLPLILIAIIIITVPDLQKWSMGSGSIITGNHNNIIICCMTRGHVAVQRVSRWVEWPTQICHSLHLTRGEGDIKLRAIVHYSDDNFIVCLTVDNTHKFILSFCNDAVFSRITHLRSIYDCWV